MTTKVDIRPLLPKVEKPGRYVGGELNQTVKDPESVDVRFALCFPDVYEIGMSYPGMPILYSLLNRVEWCGAERCFAVWPDMEGLMRQHALPLFTLETHTPLKGFDIVGFSLHFELSYTQVLAMLDLAGIPLRSADRSGSDPLVIAGGPCTLNPEPVAPFFDAFFLGDGEEGVVEISETVRAHKKAGGKRSELLAALAKIPGVYVPSFYEVAYNGVAGGVVKVDPAAPARVSRRVLKDLDSVPYPVRPVVSILNPVHDRLVVEIQRGCTRGCRFCHAGIAYRPTRMRSAASVLALAEEGLRATGHNELSLLSLSAGDYPPLPQVMSELMRRHSPDRVSLSLPSMRVETLDPALVEEIKKVRKTGFTIAPEAGSQRLRDVINKGNNDEDLFRTVKATFEAGWNLVKFYFMVGLPTETMDDVEAIAELVYQSYRVARSAKPGARLNVSVTAFIPKAHTPFQWEGMLEGAELKARLDHIRGRLKRIGVGYSTHPHDQGFVEAVLARGDRRVADAIEKAYLLGARLEAWNENFSMRRWDEAFTVFSGVTPAEFTGPRDPAAQLPWDHIDAGVTREFLLEERARAYRGERTGDCATGVCSECGVCTKDNGIKPVK
ncbi:MAG: TIGR03960 family B12-binding radical SAM protein, partial [Myxococcota bacterium]